MAIRNMMSPVRYVAAPRSAALAASPSALPAMRDPPGIEARAVPDPGPVRGGPATRSGQLGSTFFAYRLSLSLRSRTNDRHTAAEDSRRRTMSAIGSPFLRAGGIRQQSRMASTDAVAACRIHEPSGGRNGAGAGPGADQPAAPRISAPL